jgi:hypothetical protein
MLQWGISAFVSNIRFGFLDEQYGKFSVMLHHITISNIYFKFSLSVPGTDYVLKGN